MKTNKKRICAAEVAIVVCLAVVRLSAGISIPINSQNEGIKSARKIQFAWSVDYDQRDGGETRQLDKGEIREFKTKLLAFRWEEIDNEMLDITYNLLEENYMIGNMRVSLGEKGQVVINNRDAYYLR